MPDAIITSTESTFGTISGTFAADQSTVTGTITGIITGTLDGSVGVPGLGVPDGGTTGQVLQKATNTSYDTVWATPSGGAWGTITGTLSNQTDLQTALNLKAPLASPALTGVPTAPTAATLTSTTQLATTAFVQQELLSGTANARNLEVYVRNQTGSTLVAGTIVYINGATGNRPTITLAQANNDANSAQTFGFVKTAIANNGFGFVIVRGELENIDTSALTEGVQLYLSPTTAGTWTTTKPSAPQHLVYVGICVRAHPTQGVILVAVQNGYELEELHDVSIASVANNNLLAYESSTDLWKNNELVSDDLGCRQHLRNQGFSDLYWSFGFQQFGQLCHQHRQQRGLLHVRLVWCLFHSRRRCRSHPSFCWRHQVSRRRHPVRRLPRPYWFPAQGRQPERSGQRHGPH